MTHPLELWENTALLAEEFPFNAFRIRAEDCRKDQLILGMHWHEHFELLVVKEGSAVYHIEGVPYEARPGDVLLVPSGGLHVGYSLAEGQTLDYYAVVFNGALLACVPQDSAYERYLAPYVSGRIRFPVRIASREEEASPARDCVERAIAEFQDRGRAYEPAVRACLLMLFALLSREHLPERAPDSPGAALSRQSERFKPLFRYVEEHYADKLTIGQAARLVSLNPYHFCKSFKKLTGKTFIEYVNACRMNAAERLLRHSDLSVTEIADRVGCGNPNYFAKLFKQVKGMTPSQARERGMP